MQIDRKLIDEIDMQIDRKPIDEIDMQIDRKLIDDILNFFKVYIFQDISDVNQTLRDMIISIIDGQLDMYIEIEVGEGPWIEYFWIESFIKKFRWVNTINEQKDKVKLDYIILLYIKAEKKVNIS